jgi:hypothetical protein
MNRNFLAIWLGLHRELLRSIFAADLAALSDWPRPATQWEASVHAIVPWARGLLLAQSIGFNGLQIAARRPPALKAIVTIRSTDDRYADDAHYMGGTFLTKAGLE